jgi:hypothetical protein
VCRAFFAAYVCWLAALLFFCLQKINVLQCVLASGKKIAWVAATAQSSLPLGLLAVPCA